MTHRSKCLPTQMKKDTNASFFICVKAIDDLVQHSLKKRHRLQIHLQC